MASGKAVDQVFQVDPPPAAQKLREVFYMAHYVHSHIAHFYALAAPDFVVGPDAPPAERNVLGVIQKVGLEVGGEVLKHRAWAQQIQEIIGGKATHPVCNVPGGMSKPLKEEERKDIEEKARSMVEFGKFGLKLFNEVVLQNKAYVDLILSDAYQLESYYMGLVDTQDKVNFYDGQVKVIDPQGNQVAKFTPNEYLDYVGERVEPWSYLKFPFLKKIGWKGYQEGKDNGLYRVAPLARLNVASGMATPAAQEAYEQMYSTLGGKPSHATLANHWARLIEVLYAAERLLELVQDPEITDPNVRTLPQGVGGEGVGIVEAPRGTLIHHYQTDEKGITKKVNLIVATGNNHAAICMSVKKAAQGLIHKGEVSDKLLNMVEMAFRAYDPCFGCATHSLPGQMPLEVNIYDAAGNLVRQVSR